MFTIYKCLGCACTNVCSVHGFALDNISEGSRLAGQKLIFFIVRETRL